MAADVVGQCLALVQPAETAFRSRWRLSTLNRVNSELHDALIEQMHLFETALVTGPDAEARIQAEAMVRGWRAACAALESPLLPDDSYFVGFDANIGTRVVIAEHKGCLARAQRLHGDRVMLITPDEIATLMAGMDVLREVKRIFPDAEVLTTEDAVA